jgi:aspartyl-tRNA(Asn)/glutamyl-tRNA(Gln) amidotransferase subunit A
MNADLCHLTVAEGGRLFRARKLSPVEWTKALLDGIASIDPVLNAFITVTAERALTEAAEAESELSSGLDRGPFHGIPYGLKDIYDTAGISTTAHSKLLRDHLPAEDCTVQKKLRAAGGVLLGKQTTWEFALGGPSFDLPWPPARNPWDLARSPMGSSSGAGAAIAMGLCPAATGSDTGGSIRMPATVCGIAGLKPTYGLVSRKGIQPNSYSFDHAGPMAWTTEDCAIMLDVMAGYDPLDPGSIDAFPIHHAAALNRSVKGLRVGVIRHWYTEEHEAAASIVSAMDAGIALLEELGCVVGDVRLPSLRMFGDAKTPITVTEQYTLHEADLKRRPQDFGRSLRYRILPGALIRAEDYVQAMRWRAELCAEVFDIMRSFDILVTAGSFEPAPLLSADEPPSLFGVKVPSLTVPFNLTGQPALSVCNGFDKSGLPLGMQIAGRPFEDATVLALGHAFEQAAGLRSRRPSLPNAPADGARAA